MLVVLFESFVKLMKELFILEIVFLMKKGVEEVKFVFYFGLLNIINGELKLNGVCVIFFVLLKFSECKMVKKLNYLV